MLRPRAIAPAVELFPARTVTLPPATHTNSYALGGAQVLLVEPATPFDDERRAWLEWARALSSQGRTLVAIFLTHHHVDHASSAGFFARELDLPLFAHPLTLARVRDLDGVRLAPLLAANAPDAFTLDGVTPTAWEALHTPGHAPGHVCLFERTHRTLIAGDMVANGSTILIPPDDGGDMAEYLAQLTRLDALSSTLMLPAHGEPIDDPHALLTHYLAHRRMREEKILATYHALAGELRRAPTDVELVPRAYDDTAMALWPLARASLEAHLVKLRAEGRIAR